MGTHHRQFPPPVIIEQDDDDQPGPGEWTPARGLRRGTIGVVVAALVLGTLWCLLAWRRPDVVVAYKHEEAGVSIAMASAGGIVAFLLMWVLFSVMHRGSQLVGGLCPVIVVAAMLLMVFAKQATVAATPGVDTIDGLLVSGRAWLAPGRFLTSNVGVWIGMVMGVLAFREGDSLLDFFRRS